MRWKSLSRLTVSFFLFFIFGVIIVHSSPEKKILGSYSITYFTFISTYLSVLTIFSSFTFYTLRERLKLWMVPIACISLLCAAEAGCRVGYKYFFENTPVKISDAYRFHPYKIFEIIPGAVFISGNKHNSFGFRGEEFKKEKPKNEFRIFVIGGSTTYSTSSKDSYTYSEFLQKNLNKNLKGQSATIRVVNAGVRSYTSVQSLINYLTNLLQYNPDMVIVQVGINDAAARLMDDYNEDYSFYTKPFTIPASKYWEGSLLASVMFKKFASPANRWYPNESFGLADAYINDKTRKFLADNGLFKEETEGNIERNTPETFKRNLQIFKAVSDFFGIEIIFCTTPFNNKGRARDVMIAQHNEIIRKFAHEKKFNIINLDKKINWSEKLFSDDMHLKKEGQRIKAGIVSEYISKNFGGKGL